MQGKYRLRSVLYPRKMGRLRAASLLLAALAAGLLLSACGSSGNGELLPGATADRIIANLDQVRSSVDEKDCESAEAKVATVSTEVEELQKVNKKLKKALEHGALKLSEVVSSCGVAEEEAEEKANKEAEQEEQEEAEETAEEEAFELEQEDERERKSRKRIGGKRTADRGRRIPQRQSKRPRKAGRNRTPRPT
jgi:hypothetical protein